MLGKGVIKLSGLVTIGRLLQIVSALLLIKFLSPYQMGVIAFLTAVFVGVYSMVNFGFDRYLIHANDVDVTASTVNNIWTLQLIRGSAVLVLCGLIGYIAPMITDFDSEISLQLLGVGLALLIQNVSNPEIALNERKGDFNKVAYCRGLSTIGGALSVMLLIVIIASPWVYVAGKLIQTLFYCLLSFYHSAHRPRLSFDWDVMKKVLSYCKHLLVISIVSVIAVQFENYYIAISFGAEALGFYFTWARIVTMPRDMVTQISDRILFAKACGAKREGGDLMWAHLFVLAIVLALIAPFYSVVWLHGEWLIGLFAGDEWISYHWVGKYFVVISSFYLIALLFSPLVLSNFPKVSSVLRSIEVAIMVPLMIWLGREVGIEGVMIATLTTIIFALLIRGYLVYRYVIQQWYLHLMFMLGFIAVSVVSSWMVKSFIGIDGVNMPPSVYEIMIYCLYMTVMGGVVWYLFRSNADRTQEKEC